MTNREAHEEAAGYNLDDSFFTFSGIDPDATAPEEPTYHATLKETPSINLPYQLPQSRRTEPEQGSLPYQFS